MASAQVNAPQVEELIKPSEETTLGSASIEESTKAPAPENIKSPYEEDDDDDDEEEEVILPDEIAKEGDLDDEKALSPQIIEDKDDEDEDDESQEDEHAAKYAVKASDFSEEEGDDDI
ncbi:hypothetical protein QVD17_24521 [Tagetes erecta]|uniref:Uncharacterized protein n=1 Tax=Tagetes erecta TaxID=13708 RepID=A0AAD8NUT4_TARER|nr:hypothetical protein QVD17_24521 [Tagetes erecta]